MNGKGFLFRNINKIINSMEQKKNNKTEITFTQLCCLVDSIDESSVPIRFSVEGCRQEQKLVTFFEIGVGNTADEEGKLYVASCPWAKDESFSTYDGHDYTFSIRIRVAVDLNAMTFSNLALLLADTCDIMPLDKIYLYKNMAFKGKNNPQLEEIYTSFGQYEYSDSSLFDDFISKLTQNNDIVSLQKFFNFFAQAENENLIKNVNPQIYPYVLHCMIAMFISVSKKVSTLNYRAIKNIFDFHHNELSDKCIEDMASFMKVCFLYSKQNWHDFIKRNLILYV